MAALQRLAALKLRQAQLKPDLNELLQALQRESFEDRLRREAGEVRTGWRARAAALGLGLLLFFAAWLALFDLLTLDTRVAAATVAWAGAPVADGPSDVVLVAIDETTVAAVGKPFGPAWRSEHAQLVARAAQAGARVLAFDVFMPSAGDAAADAALQQALQAVQGRLPVVLAVDAYAAGRPAIAAAFAPLVLPGLGCTGQRLGRAALLPLVLQPSAAAGAAPAPLLPSLALAAFNGGAPLGRPDVVALQLQVARSAPALPVLVDFYTSETVRVPQANCPALQPGAVLASQWLDPLPFLAGRQGVPRLAYQDVLAGQPAAMAALAGRTVLVGLQLRGDDQFALAAAGGTLVWGSALIAAQIDALQRGRAVRPLGAVASWLWMTALAVAGATLALALRPRPAWQRRAAWAAAALLLVAAALLWYRLDSQVVAAHHLLLALALGGMAAAWLARRASPAGALPRWPLPSTTGEQR